MKIGSALFLMCVDLCFIQTLSALDVTTHDLGMDPDGTANCTFALQDAIDRIAKSGGGRLVIKAGTFFTGALHFKPGVGLHLEKGAVLKGSDSIVDYPLEMTRIRGVTMKYFPAMINVVGCDHFQLTGEGELNGNGFRYWREAWLRQQWKPGAPGLDSQRPRLLYVAKSSDVLVRDVTLRNPGYWTSHYYDCRNVRVVGVTCKSEVSPDDYMGNSPDGMDFDGIDGLLVKGCVVDCNDDGIVFKGGMGPWADDPVKSPDVRINRNIVIEDTHFGSQCHACIGFGSECYVASNVVVRRCTSSGAAWSFIRFKIRPDTPQIYSDMVFEDLEGGVNSLVRIDTFPRKHAFYDFGDRKEIPPTILRNICVRNVRMHFMTREYKWIDPEYPDSIDMKPIVYENVTQDKLPGKRWSYMAYRPYPWSACDYSPAVTNGLHLRGIVSSTCETEQGDIEKMSKKDVGLLRYRMMRNCGDFDLKSFNEGLNKEMEHLKNVILPAAEKQGFKVVLNMHSSPGGVNRNGETRMFLDDKYATAFKTAWLKVAKELKGHPCLYAYDLVNEPKQVRPVASGMGCLELQYEVAKAVRAIDPITPISVESNFDCSPDTFGFMEPIPLKDIIYQVHFYGPMEHVAQGAGLKYPDPARGWTKEYLRARLSTVREFQRRFGAKIYVGEVSAGALAEGVTRYLEDVISLFDEYGWDWTIANHMELIPDAKVPWCAESVQRDRNAAKDWCARLEYVKSSLDGSDQPCWFWAPAVACTSAVPLVVGLHTWSCDYRNLNHYRTVRREAECRGWAFVGPNFRGSNSTPDGCGSDLAVGDIVDAVNFAKNKVKIDASRVYIIGGSGGGHMTLLMLGRHPEMFAAGAAFCPITDLARWHYDSQLDHPGRGRRYAQMMEKACGGTPLERPDEYAHRSPITYLPRIRDAGVPVYVCTGIHDGWKGSVPVGHSIRVFNALAAEDSQVSEADIAAIEAEQKIPDGLASTEGNDPFYGENIRIHFRRTSRNVRLTLFEGGHGGNFPAGFDFLSRQKKGRPTDWTISAKGCGGEEELAK